MVRSKVILALIISFMVGCATINHDQPTEYKPWSYWTKQKPKDYLCLKIYKEKIKKPDNYTWRQHHYWFVFIYEKTTPGPHIIGCLIKPSCLEIMDQETESIGLACIDYQQCKSFENAELDFICPTFTK